jgi:hypothetical protein
MDNSRLLDAAIELVKVMDKVMDDSLPRDIADIVKSHAKGAAIAGVAGGWIPGVGGTVAIAISAGFVWTMYGRINGKIDLPFSQNIMKSVASGIATNLAGYAVGSIAISTAFSFLPGLGNFGASVIAGGTGYAITLASGFVYLKILTSIFTAGKDPTSITAEHLQEVAKKVVQNEDIKVVMKEAKEEYKSAKARGEIQEEPQDWVGTR